MGELKSRVTFSEFLEWNEYLTREEKRHTKLDVYLAQIALEVRRSFIKDPKLANLKEFLLGKGDMEQRAANSKSTWLAAVGIKKKP